MIIIILIIIIGKEFRFNYAQRSKPSSLFEIYKYWEL